MFLQKTPFRYKNKKTLSQNGHRRQRKTLYNNKSVNSLEDTLILKIHMPNIIVHYMKQTLTQLKEETAT